MEIFLSTNTLILDGCEDLNLFEDVHIRPTFREDNAAADWMTHRNHITPNLIY